MKNLKLNPFRLLALGASIIVIGAIAKITKESFSQPLFIIGLIIEILSFLLIFNVFPKKAEK